MAGRARHHHCPRCSCSSTTPFVPTDVGDGRRARVGARSGRGLRGRADARSARHGHHVAAWCHARCDATEARLTELPEATRTILINHWPLRYDLARPPRVPRFSLWCGTTRTEDWARRFRARAVISGHLHFRTTLWRHGVRYDEVSLGYPRDWRRDRGPTWYLRRDPARQGSVDRDRFVTRAGSVSRSFLFSVEYSSSSLK